MTYPILTLPEVAVLLKVAEKTVYTIARKGQIPAFKVSGQWRFEHIDINESVNEQNAVVRGHAGKGASDV